MNLDDFHIYQNYPALTDPEIIDNLPADLKANPTVLAALNAVVQKYTDPITSPFFYNQYIKTNPSQFLITACIGPADIEIIVDRFKVRIIKIYIIGQRTAEYAEFPITQIKEIESYLDEIR